MNPTPVATFEDPRNAPPLLRLPTELHLDTISHLSNWKDFAVLQLRQTNRYFHRLIDAPTHETLLDLELTSFAEQRSLYACKYCLRLRHKSKFANTMLKGKTGLNGGSREKRFCAECGFDTTKAQRYSLGTKTIVDGICWKWCFRCKLVKKGDEAGPQVCSKLCERCYGIIGCACGQCVKDTYATPKGTVLPRNNRHGEDSPTATTRTVLSRASRMNENTLVHTRSLAGGWTHYVRVADLHNLRGSYVERDESSDEDDWSLNPYL